MSAFKDLTGKKFGRLTVVSCAGRNIRKQAMWTCRCSCGNEKVIAAFNLQQGTKSCGCLQKESVRTFSRKHGYASKVARPAIYTAWRSMIDRCYYPRLAAYKNYGGRKIKVCRRWRHSFVNFLADMGEPPTEKYSIDRIDNNGNYEPGNCRWATRIEQQRNKRTNRMLTFNGETHCSAEWNEKLRLPHGTITRRLFSGWSVEQALSIPSNVKRSTHRKRVEKARSEAWKQD